MTSKSALIGASFGSSVIPFNDDWISFAVMNMVADIDGVFLLI